MDKTTSTSNPRHMLAFSAKYTINAGAFPGDLRVEAAILARMANHMLWDGTEAIERSGADEDKDKRVYGLELLHTAEALFEMSSAFYAAADQATGVNP